MSYNSIATMHRNLGTITRSSGKNYFPWNNKGSEGNDMLYNFPIAAPVLGALYFFYSAVA
jgi:hypothetical protein